MKHQKTLLVLGCVLAALLASCDSGSSSSKPATVNGVFADALMVGMPFECGTEKGMTGSGGEFACPGGSTVTFSIGGIIVCTAPVLAFMTPVSCAQATNASANTTSPDVVAAARFLISISTTPPSSGNLTITAAELAAATSLSLDFSTATDVQLQAAVTAISPGATLVSAMTAENELNTVVFGSLAGNFSGTFSGSGMGTWMITVAADGTVTGSGVDSKGHNFTISGSLVSGTTYSGTAGTATWTGTMDTSQSPIVFSGTYTDPGGPGTFTGKKQ